MAIPYDSNFTNTNGLAFPNTASVNASGAGATDGTEYKKLFVDDIWGYFQAIMDQAGLTPNGVTESATASQRMDALRRIFGGPGEWVIWTKNADPSVTGDRVLFLNGQGILRASYPLLDDAVYVGDVNNASAPAFYRADDAAGTIRNIAGAYLILPETRGYALRGLDVAASVDPDGAGRSYGSVQLDAFQGHWHELANSQAVISAVPSGGNISGTGAFAVGTSISDPISDGANGNPRTSSESRMTNVAVQFGIRY